MNEAGIELQQVSFPPAHLASLVTLVDRGKISGKQAKLVLEEMFRTGEAPDAIAVAKGLEQISDEGAVKATVDEVIAENPDAVDKVRAGQLNTVGFLVGQVMKKTRGKANPGLVNELLRKKLTGG